VDENIKHLKLDMKVRHEMFLIFKKMLRAIAEEANDSTSIINIDYSGKKLLMKIQNNAVKLSGINAEQMIEEIIQRAESIHAEPDIQNDSKGISLILLVSL